MALATLSVTYVDGNVLTASDLNSNFSALNNATVPVLNGGTGLTVGVSGGVPFFSSTSAMGTSALLTANGVVLGGGAGTAPSATAAGSANEVVRVPSGGGAPAFGAVNLAAAAAVTGQLVATSMPALTGDVTTAGGALATTLANAGPGATGPIGSATVAPVITIDAKGRVTALTSATITGGAENGTWDLTVVRAVDTVYQNTTGESMRVALAASTGDGANNFLFYTGTANPPLGLMAQGGSTGATGATLRSNVFCIVPNNWYYRVVQNAGTTTLDEWAEMPE